MNNPNEIDYTKFRKSISNPNFRFLDPILKLAGGNYFIRAITTTETGAMMEICAAVSQEQFDELKRIGNGRKGLNIYAQLNKPEEA